MVFVQANSGRDIGPIIYKSSCEVLLRLLRDLAGRHSGLVGLLKRKEFGLGHLEIRVRHAAVRGHEHRGRG